MTDFATPGPTDRWHVVGSPIGDLLLTGDGRALTGLHMLATGEGADAADPSWRHDPEAFAEAEAQLRAYFDGELAEFDLELAPSGTPFQIEVWRALLDVPYGETTSYGEIARQLGKPSAFRAVGAANGRNPIAVIVPCHRIIGSAGSLVGYGGGLDRKRLLLDLEAGLLSLVPERADGRRRGPKALAGRAG
jgi:methylated-DNA-[protein]-cysteine S-methyltransferase